MDEDEGILYAYDNIIVQLRENGIAFDQYLTRELPLVINLTDLFEPGIVQGDAISPNLFSFLDLIVDLSFFHT